MTTGRTDGPTRRRPLRLWPGIVAAVLLWLIWYLLPIVAPDFGMAAALGGLAGGLLIVVWWAFFSRVAGLERWGAIVLMIAALAVTPRILHESIVTGGMGFMYYGYAVPVLGLAFVAWAVVTRRLSDGPRRATMVATILLACSGWVFLRTDGVSHSGSDFAWRWSQTAEERLLARVGEEPPLPSAPPAPLESRQEGPEAQVDDEPAVVASAPMAADTGEEPLQVLPTDQPALVQTAGSRAAAWPGFRGPHRDGVVPGVGIATDWTTSPPVELWRRPIGPGWSSFAVHGDLLFTQEQRGEDELVACYHVTTGEPVWRHSDTVRFWESNAGAGPRATPTLSDGSVYTFGATGIVNALDAADGSVVWSREVVADSGVEVPYWGFASSPLLVDDLVVVAASGRLVAYDRTTGEPRWLGPTGPGGYSSPHLATIDGAGQILLLDGAGVTSVAPADGTVLWQHAWSGSSIVQPARTADGDLLISALGVANGLGVRRLVVARESDRWTLEERWTSSGLKPYFNDFVVHEGHAYGFDGAILASIDLADGKRRWKGGRYGQGQLVLLPDQDLLLVVTERGELALVSATPDRFTELARIPVLEGKTWNHPALVGDLLLVRNGQEMAAFRLPRAHG